VKHVTSRSTWQFLCTDEMLRVSEAELRNKQWRHYSTSTRRRETKGSGYIWKQRTYSGSEKYDDAEDADVGLLVDEWHLQHWLPMPAPSCKKDISSRHLKSTQHLTCLTPRHHLLPVPHTNYHSTCPSLKPASVNGYFCLSVCPSVCL